jgi:hypothetical protein
MASPFGFRAIAGQMVREQKNAANSFENCLPRLAPKGFSPPNEL